MNELQRLREYHRKKGMVVIDERYEFHESMIALIDAMSKAIESAPESQVKAGMSRDELKDALLITTGLLTKWRRGPLAEALKRMGEKDD